MQWIGGNHQRVGIILHLETFGIYHVIRILSPQRLKYASFLSADGDVNNSFLYSFTSTYRSFIYISNSGKTLSTDREVAQHNVDGHLPPQRMFRVWCVLLHILKRKGLCSSFQSHIIHRQHKVLR